MLIEGAVTHLILINIFTLFVLQTGLALLATRMPAAWFTPRKWLYRTRRFEQGGHLYESQCAIKRWKHRLTEGARFLRQEFIKGKLSGRDRKYLDLFCNETCRAEAAHWAQLSCAPLFFIWNPFWAGCIMIVYALLVNLPCIMAQRYNRIRLLRIQTSKLPETKATS